MSNLFAKLNMSCRPRRLAALVAQFKADRAKDCTEPEVLIGVCASFCCWFLCLVFCVYFYNPHPLRSKVEKFGSVPAPLGGDSVSSPGPRLRGARELMRLHEGVEPQTRIRPALPHHETGPPLRFSRPPGRCWRRSLKTSGADAAGGLPHRPGADRRSPLGTPLAGHRRRMRS